MQYHYFPASHWSRVVSLALAEKGIEPERVFVDIRAHDTFTPTYIRLNPKGVVPTLVVDESTIVCNGVRIVEYLDGLGGAPLIPADDEGRARLDELVEFPMMLLSYSIWVKGLKGERSAQILEEKVALARENAGKHPELAEQYERKAKFFEEFMAEVYDPARVMSETARCAALLDALGRRVSDGETWAAGASYSLADCLATSILYRLRDLGLLDAWSRDPANPLHAYFERLAARPSFERVWSTDPLLARL